MCPGTVTTGTGTERRDTGRRGTTDLPGTTTRGTDTSGTTDLRHTTTPAPPGGLAHPPATTPGGLRSTEAPSFPPASSLLFLCFLSFLYSSNQYSQHF